MTWQVLQGDARERLRELPPESVQTCVTSPPYFGLRDYGTGEWEGGELECDHSRHVDYGEKSDTNRGSLRGGPMGQSCDKCGARRVDRQIGLEPTPDEFVAALVETFREVRRVLRDDGTLWLNLGDSYANGGAGTSGGVGSTSVFRSSHAGGGASPSKVEQGLGRRAGVPVGYKPKDLLGIPWMVAFALRADGWYLRSDIIWSKPNPMPESVTDRPTKAHEYLFLLSKSPRYYWDADAIREDTDEPGKPRIFGAKAQEGTGRQDIGNEWQPVPGRNKRSVWTVATQPYPGAHFATFPPKLIEPCVLAGSSDRACGVCGAPWERVVEREPPPEYDGGKASALRDTGAAKHRSAMGPSGNGLGVQPIRTLGWEPTCEHNDDSGSSVVLDPFAGAGTTGVVALRHDRSFVGIELNPEYVELARYRILDDAPLMNSVAQATEMVNPGGLALPLP